MATVMGPTPPGTGVMRAATSATLAKWTSPQIRPSSRLWMPTSTTTAPGLTHSAVTCSGRPIATISRSAWRARAGASRVAVWQTVDGRQELGLGRRGGQSQQGAVHPGRRAGLLLAADVDQACRVVADQDDRQARDHAGSLGQLGDLRRHLAADPLCQGFAIEDL